MDAGPRPLLLREGNQAHLSAAGSKTAYAVIALHPTVVVTGATGAIGSATASVLARRGARLVLMARPSDQLDALVERLGGTENRVVSAPVDLSSMASVRAAAREINRAGGHIDALLNVTRNLREEVPQDFGWA